MGASEGVYKKNLKKRSWRRKKKRRKEKKKKKKKKKKRVNFFFLNSGVKKYVYGRKKRSMGDGKGKERKIDDEQRVHDIE